MKIIEEFAEVVQNDNIQLHSCVYLHNYKKAKLDQLKNSHYEEVVQNAPVFIREELKSLRRYIIHFITRPAERNLVQTIDCSKLRSSKSLQDTLSDLLNDNGNLNISKL